MGTGCCGDRKPPFAVLDDQSEPRCEGAPIEVRVSDVSELFFTRPSFLTTEGEEHVEDIPMNVLATMDECFQNSGFVWSETRAGVVAAGKLLLLTEGEVLFTRGDLILSVFITNDGEFRSVHNEIDNEPAPGITDSMYFDTYQDTVIAARDSSVYEFPISSFKHHPKGLAAASLVMNNSYLRVALTNHAHFSEFRLCRFDHGAILTTLEPDDVEVILIKEGSVVEDFGDVRLIIDAADWVVIGLFRDVTAKARKSVVGYRINPETLDAVFHEKRTEILWKSEFLQVLLQHSTTKSLPPSHLLALFYTSKFYHDHEPRLVASTSKSASKKVITVLKGQLVNRETTEELAMAGEMFNLRVATTASQYLFRENVVSGRDAVYVTTPRCELHKYLSPKVKQQLSLEGVLLEMKRICLFSFLPLRHLKSIAEVLDVKVFKNGDIILHQDHITKRMYIVLSGRVLCVRGQKTVRTFEQFDYFGESAIQVGSKSTYTCVAIENVVCWEISFGRMGTLLEDAREEFERRITTKVFALTADQLIVKHVLKYNQAMRTLQVSAASSSQISYVVFINPTTLPSKERKLMAMEVRMLRELSSLHLPYLYSQMYTTQHSMIVLKYAEGVTLRNVIDHHPEVLTERLVKTYVAYLLLALQCLHNRNIVHLHIRPETIYIDSSGLPALLYLRGAQYRNSIYQDGIEVSEYSAPEVKGGGELGPASDLWSLGVVILECLAAGMAIGMKGVEIEEMKRLVDMPEFYMKLTFAAVSMLNVLLFKRDFHRLTADIAISHEWLNRVDWARTRLRLVSSKVFIPSKSDIKYTRETSLTQPITLQEYLRTVLSDPNPITFKQ